MNLVNSFTLNNTKYIIEDTLQNNFYVGIKIINNEYHLYFPIGFEIKDNNDKYNKKILKYLYKTVLLTKGINEEKYKDKSDKENKTIPIQSYLYILSDYFTNGLYSCIEKKYKKDRRGKINWKKTFQNNFYNQNNNVLYLDTVIEYNKRETNIISLLQLYCVNKAIDVLIFLGDYSKPYSELTDKDINNNIEYYNNIIEKELKYTNQDKKKLLLSNIKNILNDCCDSEKNTRSFGTLSYQYAFEKMIDNLFSNQKDISKFYPTALWQIDDDEEFESSKLREDTIWIGEKEAYVIDSKYYRYGVEQLNSLLPNTKTIYKQMVYGEYVKKELAKEKDYKVYNIFIIPSNQNEFIQYKGKAKMKLLERNQTYDEIYLCLINMNEVIDRYFEKKCNSIQKLISVIEKHRKR